MTQRTRYFLVGSGLIVVVGLCTGLVAYYNGELGGRRAPLSEFAYVPATVTAVAYADVRHIMSSEFHHRLRATMPAGPEKARLLAETGIDLERDIDTVVAGLSPSDVLGGPVVLVRGRFNEAQIESVAVQHGATVEDFSGKRILKSLDPRAAGEPGGSHPAVAFLEPGLIALGQLDAVKHAITAADRRETVAANAEVMKVVNDVLGDGDAWLVGRVESMSDHARLPSAVRDQLAGLQWFSLSAAIDQAMSCKLRAEASNAEAGEALRGVVNGALAVARIMAGNDARLDTLLQSVQASGTGSKLELSFTVPAEALDALRQTAGTALPAPR
jgi:hypothetical protein